MSEHFEEPRGLELLEEEFRMPGFDSMVVEPVAELIDVGQSLLAQTQSFLLSLLRESNLFQIAIAIGLFGVAYLLRLVLGPRIRAWMGSREGWPKWRMRVLAVIHQRLLAIFYVALLWSTVYLMREITWPSRSHLLSIFASLVLQ